MFQQCYCYAQSVSLRNLQNALSDLAKVRIGVRFDFGSRLGSESDLELRVHGGDV